MTSVLLIIVIIVLYSLQSLFCTIYTARYTGKPENASPVFCTLEGIAIALFTWAWIGFKFEVSLLTLLFGILNAVALFGYNTSLIRASAKGPYAFMMVAMLFGGILVPLLYSTMFLGEQLQWYQYAAIVLMLVSFVLMNHKEIKLKGTSWSYYIYCAILFLSNGLYGTLLKVQSVYDDSQKNEMIILTYGFVSVIGLVQLMIKEKKNTLSVFRFSKKAVLPLVLCLICAAVAINMLVLAIPMINVAVLYTVENGGVLLLSAIYSFIFFKEKPQFATILGIIVATASITILSI